jgi:hypothetical protein
MITEYLGFEIDMTSEGLYRAYADNGCGGLRVLRADTLPGLRSALRVALHTAYDFCGYPLGYCDGRCDVCGRCNAWGCGHSGAQRWAARRHAATAVHRDGRCACGMTSPHPAEIIAADVAGQPLGG